MSQTKEQSSDILLNMDIHFQGLSHVALADDEVSHNTVYLITDSLCHEKGAVTPTIKGKIKDPLQFVEIFKGFFASLTKGMLYKPSGEMKAAGEELASLIKQKTSLSSIEYYQKMFDILARYPEPRKAGIDPLLTVKDGICYFEAFDKYLKRYITLKLKADLWEDGVEMTDGTAHINYTSNFMAQLTGINPKDPLEIQIGMDVGDHDNPTDWKGDLKKSFPLELQDVRELLILQGSAALSEHQVDLIRVDFFNTLYHLRLHKAKTHESFNDQKEDASIVFSLKPNQIPKIILKPWDWEVPGNGVVYQGKKSIELVIGGRRRDLLTFDNFLPFINRASFTLFENNLHYCVEIGNDAFDCTMVLAGYGRSVWYRRLQMEAMLPAFSTRNATVALQGLDRNGSHQLVGSENLVERKNFIAEILRGQAFFVPSSNTFIKRSFFGAQLDMDRLLVLGFADTQGRSFLNNGNVQMLTQYEENDALNFQGSTVTEDLREGETEPFVAQPKFTLDVDGILRKVGCSCTVWKEEGEHGYGGPCAHLRALWLNYCQEIEALREAKSAGIDTGPKSFEKRIFTKGTEERIVSFDVRRKYFFSEQWRGEAMAEYRQSTQVYTTEESLRKAFQRRCDVLAQKGFAVAE